MKKLILSAAFVALGVAAFAQKPAAGDKTAEVNFTGFGLNSFDYTVGDGNLQIPELRFRYFMSDKMALRARIGLQSSSATVKETDGTLNLEAKVNDGFGLTLSPGVEFHFEGTSKLSPYYGAQLGIGYRTGGSLTVTNATGWTAAGGFTGNGDGNKLESTGQSLLGINLGVFMGADYYITDAVFVGGEFGLGLFNMTSVGEGEDKETTGGNTTTTKTGTASGFDLFGVTSGNVRLGFRF
jgi:outer membrane protein W